MTNEVKVTITGVSGYVGAHVCPAFVQDGRFQVTGKVRSTKDKGKVKAILEAILEDAPANKKDRLKLVEADLLHKESILRACFGAEYIVNIAAAVPSNNKKHTDDELVHTTKSGVLAVMEAARRNKNRVKKVVMTSSSATIYHHHVPEEGAAKILFDENGRMHHSNLVTSRARL